VTTAAGVPSPGRLPAPGVRIPLSNASTAAVDDALAAIAGPAAVAVCS
jgi:hypothetical protein